MARLRTAAVADILEQRLWPGEQRPGQEQALAQPGLGGLDPGEAAALDDRLEDQRSGEDDVAAPGLDARDRAALARG